MLYEVRYHDDTKVVEKFVEADIVDIHGAVVVFSTLFEDNEEEDDGNEDDDDEGGGRTLGELLGSGGGQGQALEMKLLLPISGLISVVAVGDKPTSASLN